MGDEFVGTKLTLDQAMQVALRVAMGGIGKVSPNPLVGAVLLAPDGTCLATGFHAFVGGPHAEADLLDKLQEDQIPKGSTMAVTLEPCAHKGRTPSCAHRLAKLPLGEVVYGLMDPNEKASGGAQVLKNAGIKATEYQGPLKDSLKELCEVFYHNVKTGLPFVALKCGATLDGKIALRESGESQWITGEVSRLHTHFLRAMYDAVLIGERTFVVDNPSLTVRHPDFPDHENKVVILSPRGEAWPKFEGSKIGAHHKPENIIWVSAPGFEPKSDLVCARTCPLTADGFFDTEVLLKNLIDGGIYSLLVEGGSRTLSKFLTDKAAQRLHLFVAPKILGGKGLDWAEGFAVAHLDEALEIQDGRWSAMGEDLYFTGRLQ